MTAARPHQNIFSQTGPRTKNRPLTFVVLALAPMLSPISALVPALVPPFFHLLVHLLAWNAPLIPVKAYGSSTQITDSAKSTEIQGPIDEARDALARGKIALAIKKYRSITWNSPLYGLKLQDLAHWHLSLEKPPVNQQDNKENFHHGEEAYLLISLAERLGITWDQQEDHKTLAGLEAGLCTVDWPMTSALWRTLMQAYFVRYAHLYRRSREPADPYDAAARGRRISLQTLKLKPFVREIATSDGYTRWKIFKGRGCTSWQDEFEDFMVNREDRYHAEFRLLKAWWLMSSTEGIPLLPLRPGSGEAMVRLLTLALQKPSKTENIIAPAEKDKNTAQQPLPASSASQRPRSGSDSSHEKQNSSTPTPRLRDEALADDLLQALHPLEFHTPSGKKIWHQLSRDESRFIFQKLVDGKKIPAPPYPPSTPLYNALLARIHAADDLVDAVEWLDLLDNHSLKAADRLVLEKILDNILNKRIIYLDDSQISANVPSNKLAASPDSWMVGEATGCLILNRGKLAYLRGDIPLALSLIRRILVGGESSASSDLLSKAESLALMIVDDYRYDQAVLALVHSLFPRNLWSRIFTSLTIEHALRGEAKEFEQMGALLKKGAFRRSLLLSDDEEEILRALATRQSGTFAKTWENLNKNNLRLALRFAFTLGERTLSLRPHERSGIAPYLATIRQSLEKIQQSGQKAQRIDQLIDLYSPSGPPQGRYEEGRQTALGATVHAGVVKLRDDKSSALEKCSLTWSAPKQLALRPLLPRLKRPGSQDWEIH